MAHRRVGLRRRAGGGIALMQGAGGGGRWQGPAAGLNAISSVLAAQMQNQFAMQRDREAFAQRYRQATSPAPQGLLSEEGMKRLTDQGAVITHQIKTPEGTITIKRGGQTGAGTDQLQQANRVAQLQSRIQGIDQRNALAPGIAMADRLKAYPNPAWGGVAGPGYVDNPPNWLQTMTGVQQRPPAAAVPMVDTSYLRSQLDAAMGQGTPTPLLHGPAAPASPMGGQPPLSQQPDTIIRTGKDQATGKRVGMTRSGQIIPLE